ncbi:neuropeptide Y receptor type 5-like [Scyliorhinus canicula]|uniref:neuropeptide Y receptor type 5-like n=1 Tax=Scyliorhinus canicula TaxID=7830 RepID=UPI0018F73808|nr:neuropeptide Y receptor type 5-like [Scyliorhinus canicula]XP_038647821.1 neuropeptide Y receptor type 5-like [Scyliorhinus canicula]XP_038647822.1 neuropeptide Y receptor type 5-like [Scyliorhinus canicula]
MRTFLFKNTSSEYFEIQQPKMDLEGNNKSNVTVTWDNGDNTTAYGFGFPSWDDYNGSIHDIRYLLVGIYTFITVLGLLGNFFVVFALCKNLKQKSMVNFLIGNLALSDILILLFCSPFTLTYVLLDQWIFGEIMCYIVPFVQCVSVMVSILMLMSIAMVRYHMINNPLSNHFTINTGYLVMGTVWIIGFTICSPLPIFHKIIDLSETVHLESLKNKYLCIESWPSDTYRIAYTLSLLIIQYILPIVCLTISHASVCRKISATVPSRQRRSEENEMINLTIHQPANKQLQAQHSKMQGWNYSFLKKHKKRYSKKCASVMPVVANVHKNGQSRNDLLVIHGSESIQPLPTLFLPGVPVCFELKATEPEEHADSQNVSVTPKSITRLRKRSRIVFYKLTIVIVAFTISWMPLHIFHLLTDFNANLISNRHFKLVYCICHLLGLLSCCLNPVLYGFLNNGIKSSLQSLAKRFWVE